jgi:hypothetical protein
LGEAESGEVQEIAEGVAGISVEEEVVVPSSTNESECARQHQWLRIKRLMIVIGETRWDCEEMARERHP